MTRAEILREALEAADARGSGRWATATMLLVLDSIYRDEWADILNDNVFYRTGLRTPTVASDGSFAWSDLDSGSGDNLERVYRIIGITSGEGVYEPSTLKRNLRATTVTGAMVSQRGHYYQQGDLVLLRPIPTQPLSVWVNHMPTKPSLLSSDDVEVVFPEDRSMILVYELAAHLLAKGGAEVDAARALKGLAEAQREKMASDLSRIEIDPKQFDHFGSNAEWGG